MAAFCCDGPKPSASQPTSCASVPSLKKHSTVEPNGIVLPSSGKHAACRPHVHVELSNALPPKRTTFPRAASMSLRAFTRRTRKFGSYWRAHTKRRDDRTARWCTIVTSRTRGAGAILNFAGRRTSPGTRRGARSVRAPPHGHPRAVTHGWRDLHALVGAMPGETLGGGAVFLVEHRANPRGGHDLN